MARRTIGIVVVGNEVLAGKVVEQNAAYLIRRFRELGARVREVVIVEDDPPAIAQAVQRLAAVCDDVLTTGGVGPTHDDVTVEAVAHAFGVPVVESPLIVEKLAAVLRRTPAAGHRRLAKIPDGAELIFGTRFPWPILHIGRVWLFPGVPAMLQVLFEDLEERFVGSPPWCSAVLELIAEESAICESLDALVAKHATVAIGSYPRREEGAWRLRLTFEGDTEAAVKAALADAENVFGEWMPPSS